jgi:hypothetical protein
MASLKDAEKLTDDLSGLVDQLRSELRNGGVDFERLIEIADQISERADGMAGTFATVNEALMSRIDQITSGSGRGKSSGGSSSESSSSSSDTKAKSGSKS